MSFRNYERGQVTVLTALCLAVLLGFVALAADVGALFRWRRNLQIVTDAAATAGALDYYKNGLSSTSSAVTAAESAVTSNGLTSATFSTTCPITPSGSVPQACISLPPSSGVHTSNGFVEVQLVQPRPTTFMSFFGFGNINVTTRAVAGLTTGQACIWVKQDLNISGNAGLCGVDPKNPGTWTGKCGSGTVCPANGAVTACGVYVGRNITGSGGGGGSNCIASSYVAAGGSVGVPLNPSPAVGNAPAQTPPSFLTQTPKAPADCTSWNQGLQINSMVTGKNKNNPNFVDATLTGSPTAGCYGVDGIQAGWDATNTQMTLHLANATLGDGEYLFDLGTVNGGGNLLVESNVGNKSSAPNFDSTYTGVTMDLYTGNFTVASSSTGINLYAPNDGSNPLNGILLQEPLSNTGTINIQWGSASSNFYGYIVGPGATLTMQDQGGGAIVSGIYVGTMTLNSELGVVNYNAKVTGAPGKTIALVE